MNRKPAPSTGPILTTEEAARYLRIGKSTLYKLANEGVLPHGRAGTKFVFHVSVLDEFARGGDPRELAVAK